MTRVTGLDPAEKDDTFFDQTLPRAAQAALEQNGAEFDRMVADEAQDLIPWLGVLDRCLKGGLERGKWSLFGDFSRQAIYADDQTPEDLLAQLEDMASFARYRLNLNCRNTREMCRVLETITGFDPGRPMRYEVSGGPVRSILWKTREEELEKLEDLLKELHHEQIPPEKITILSPVRRETSVVAGVTAFPIDDFQVPPSGYITFSTIHGFKGLENTVILLTDMENYNNRTLLYVGLSRATARLYVFQNKKADQQYGELLIRRLLSKDGGYQT